jgi:hypothetical protein
MAPSIWCINNEALSHMIGFQENFTDLKYIKVKIEISLGDDTLVKVVGIGIVTFQRDSMQMISFRDVLYVPGLKKNLILVSTLQDRGLEVTFRGIEVLIHPRGSSLTLGQVIGVTGGKLFIFLFQPLHALVVSSDSSRQSCELWNHRMAHLHHGALRGLREDVTKVPQISIDHQDVCIGCALGNFTKASFPRSDTRSVEILDLVQTNMCGPMNQRFLSGCEYYLTFIDDYLRNTWIYLLKAKSEIFTWFQEFRSLMENQSGKRIKFLRSDNGGEYSSRQFVDV